MATMPKPLVTPDVLDRALEAFDDAYEGQLEVGAAHWTDNREQAMRSALQAALDAQGDDDADERRL